MQDDDHAVCVGEEALILLDLESGEGAAEFCQKRPAEELGQGEVIELGKLRLEFFLTLPRVRRPDPEHVHQRATGVPDRFENLLQAALAVVLDHDARTRREVGFEIGIGAPEVSGRNVQAAFMEPSRNGFTFNQELDFEAGQQDLVEHPDGQFGLANGETPHLRLGTPTGDTLDAPKPQLYSRYVTPAGYQFGAFRFDRVAYQVARGAEILDLTPKLLDLLLYLLERPATLVTKEELLDALWPGANVTENALAQAVSDLRQQLGDVATSPQFIRTVARRGYRFVASVTPIVEATRETPPVRSSSAAAAGRAAGSAAAAPESGLQTIAVLDFAQTAL